VLLNLAALPLFLSNRRFKQIGESFILSSDLSPELYEYLQQFIPISNVPVRASNEIVAYLGLKNDPMYTRLLRLTPSKLREVLRNDRFVHATNFSEDLRKFFTMFHVCTSDYRELDSSLGEFAVRRMYMEAAGCPLLLMSDMTVKPFPQDAQARMTIAPYPLHHLLPSLKPFFIHPYLLRCSKLFHNAAFKDATMISFFNCGFLSNHMSTIFPREFNQLLVVSRGSLPMEPSGSVLYAIWKFGLTKESPQSLEALSAWPVVPVVSRGKRLLASTKLMQYLLVMLPSSQQDTERAQLGQEMAVYDSQV
jgi:hypothetical protein